MLGSIMSGRKNIVTLEKEGHYQKSFIRFCLSITWGEKESSALE